MGVFSKLRVTETESEIFREINEWERFIDEACVELNVEVKTAENEVQERKLREEAACVRGRGAVENVKQRQSCDKSHGMEGELEPEGFEKSHSSGYRGHVPGS